MIITEWNRHSLPQRVIEAFESVVSQQQKYAAIAFTEDRIVPLCVAKDWGVVVSRMQDAVANKGMKVYYCDTYGIHQW